MSQKIPYITKEKAEQIAQKYPTPFYLYDEAGIRNRARLVNKAFAWNKGFKEYFADFKRRKLRRGLLVPDRAANESCRGTDRP